VVNALKPSQSKLEGEIPQLRVVNGMSTATSSALTTAAQENFPISRASPVDGLPGRTGNSTVRWGGGLNTHPEVLEHEGDALSEDMPIPVVPAARQPITPSLATLEKAVSARIYFENLYFPLLRHAPSREQRRLAMERDMVEMQLNEKQKDNLRARWRRNETEYLRDKRRKVDASAFIKLKTIGHGIFNMF
jgi:protein-serine/threonine kinase